MNQLEYAIQSSFIGKKYELDSMSYICEVIEKALPKSIWSKINQASTHEEEVKAYDLVTDFINENETRFMKAFRLN